jgi:carbamoyltransferase
MVQKMNIIGLHPFGHDSTIVFLNAEKKKVETLTLERYTRKKHDMNYVVPKFLEKIQNFSATVLALSSKEGRPADIKMFKSLQRIYEINAIQRKRKLSLAEVVELAKERLLLRTYRFKRKYESFEDYINLIKKETNISRVVAYDHHACHGYSALWTSDLTIEDKVLVVTIDGQGDETCASLSTATNGKITRQITVPNAVSLCLLYSYFTEVAGFNPNADEGKLEALACYFEEKDSSLLEKLRSWINFDAKTLSFNLSPTPSIPFTSIQADRVKILSWLKIIYKQMDDREFAYAIQTVFEEKYLAWVKAAKQRFGSRHICMAGGGIANVKLNLRIFEEAGFENMHIIPAMGDDGVALGAAIIAGLDNNIEIGFIAQEKMPYWGHAASREEINQFLTKARQQGFQIEGPFESLALSERVAHLIGNNKICSVFRGSAEYGPRALGHRSILANPTDPKARDAINNKFKRREWFQPFCPIMTEDEAERILERHYRNKHMTCAFRVKPQFSTSIPSVVHVDNTARAQIINKTDEPFIYSLMLELKKITGFAVLLNTSFNLHGRAMVNTPMHALDDFIDCGIDYLVIEDYLIGRA